MYFTFDCYYLNPARTRTLSLLPRRGPRARPGPVQTSNSHYIFNPREKYLSSFTVSVKNYVVLWVPHTLDWTSRTVETVAIAFRNSMPQAIKCSVTLTSTSLYDRHYWTEKQRVDCLHAHTFRRNKTMFICRPHFGCFFVLFCSLLTPSTKLFL
jgi:hypothetical protein